MSTGLSKTAGGFLVHPQGMADMWKICQVLADSSLVPKDYIGRPENVFAALQLGGELGLSPMQALQNIAVINGRGSVWGDAQLALCMAHPDYVDTVETFDRATMTATCVAKRNGRSDKGASFSLADAKLAKLLDKSNTPWQTYPERMLKARARGFALRDQWTDVLKGVLSREEAQDIPTEVRAEVVEQPDFRKRLDPAKAEDAADAQPKSSPTDEIPRFSEQWTDKNWAGKPLAEAPSAVLLDYGQYLSTFAEDKTRPKRQASAKAALDLVSGILAERMDAEQRKAADALLMQKAAQAKEAAAAAMKAEPDHISSQLQKIVDMAAEAQSRIPAPEDTNRVHGQLADPNRSLDSDDIPY